MATATARRMRLDQLLVERGLAETRARAQALVLAGQVRVGEGDGARARPQERRSRGRRRPDRGRGRSPVGEPRRAQAARGARRVRRGSGGPCRDRRRRLDGRLHGRPARPRRDAGLRGRRRATGSSPSGSATIRASCRWSASTPGRSTPSTLPEPVDLAVVDVSFISLGLVLGADPRRCCATARGRSSPSSSRSSRPARPTPRAASCATPRSTAACCARPWRAPRPPGSGCAGVIASPIPGRRATASSSSISRPGPAARRSTS